MKRTLAAFVLAAVRGIVVGAVFGLCLHLWGVLLAVVVSSMELAQAILLSKERP